MGDLFEPDVDAAIGVGKSYFRYGVNPVGRNIIVLWFIFCVEGEFGAVADHGDAFHVGLVV